LPEIVIGNSVEFVHLLPLVKTTATKKSAEAAQLPQAADPSDQWALFDWTRKEIVHITLLLVLAVACWCYFTGRTSVRAWQVPLEYGMKGADGDAQGVLAYFKAAQEGDFHPVGIIKASRLSAPYQAAWSDVPIVEKWEYYLPGVLARFVGLFAAANASIMAAQVLACLCFYLVARLMNCKWWWAFAGGLVFGFSQFAMARSLHHMNVTHFWYVPFCVLIADWTTRNEMGDSRGQRYAFALFASFYMGTLNPYYTNMFLQLVLLGAFYQYFRQGWKPVLQAAGIVGASALGFLVMNLDTFAYHLKHGSNPGGLVRPYIWLELSALKFVDMLVPPPDHPLFGWMGQAYYGLPGKAGMVAFPCEVPPSCYLGLLGLGCLLWLAIVSVRRLVAEPGRNLPVEAWQVLWILAYSAVGGLNCLAGVLGVNLFRSSTRYCIFILPILLLFAIKRLSKKRMDIEVGIAAAGICALVALWDQTPPVAEAEAAITEVATVVDSDREFAQKIEARLPKGAMVFQIPIMEYPESPAPGMPSYDHFRPYLHSKDLRFSFGGIKGRPWLEWQKDLGQQKHSFQDIVRAVESYGFAAVYVSRNGFQDKGEAILQAFKQLGYTEVIENKLGDLFCVMIHPAAHPLLPAGTVE